VDEKAFLLFPAAFAGNPFRVVERQTAAGHDTVQVRMIDVMDERLS
jgi:hypothetical protein